MEVPRELPALQPLIAADHDNVGPEGHSRVQVIGMIRCHDGNVLAVRYTGCWYPVLAARNIVIDCVEKDPAEIAGEQGYCVLVPGGT